MPEYSGLLNTSSRDRHNERMARLALRHWTAILIAVAVAAWAIFYVPQTPSWTIFQLKQAVDARDGVGAARYVDFQSVVQNAGSEMVSDQNSSNGSAGSLLGALVGNGVVSLLSGPMASLLKSWAIQQVDNGAKQVQIPAAAAAGAIALLHRNGDAAYTRWTDNKGQVWEVRLGREEGGWKIVQVKNVKQLLEKLQQQQENRINEPAPGALPPDTGSAAPPSSGP
ncbi:MAG TPA: DUF2939 domain-containing protein [Candidatus Binataceae bacterium]|nr:DUF2939 domain-containing protein [Candidatus Binataceae bacterium]